MAQILSETAGSAEAARTHATIPVALGLACIVMAFVIGFLPSILWMAGEWSASSGALSHGYLVVAISAVLLLRAIPQVAAGELLPAWWLLPVVLGLSVVWLLGYVATVVAVQTMVLPAILLAAVVAAYGLKASRPLVFAILFIYFAVPAWDHLNFIFQAITVFVVGTLIRVTGIPALLYGNFVELSVGTFQIAGGCSGLSFVIAGLSLAVLYAHLYYTRLRQKILLLMLTLLMAMLGNWIRVYTIILIGYRTRMQSSMVDDHLTFGWILFGVLLVPVFFVARRLEDIEPAGTIKPDIRTKNAGINKPAWTGVGAAVVAMLAGPIWANTVSQSRVAANSLELQLPPGSGDWQGPQQSRWDWAPEFAGATVERTVQYGSDGKIVLVYANLYLSQEQDKELVFVLNSLSGSWREARPDNRVSGTVTSANGLEFRQLAARNYAGNWLIWYRYQVGGRYETNDVQAKIAQAWETLKGRPEAGIIAFAAPCAKSCDDAAAVLHDFVEEFGHTIQVNSSRDNK